MLLDGNEAGSFDLFSPNLKIIGDSLGRRTVTAGDHVLRFECTGRNTASKGYLLGFDCLQARVPAYARPEGKDLRELQARP